MTSATAYLADRKAQHCGLREGSGPLGGFPEMSSLVATGMLEAVKKLIKINEALRQERAAEMNC